MFRTKPPQQILILKIGGYSGPIMDSLDENWKHLIKSSIYILDKIKSD